MVSGIFQGGWNLTSRTYSGPMTVPGGRPDSKTAFAADRLAFLCCSAGPCIEDTAVAAISSNR